MTKITWDQVGARKYESGVDHGVLYIPDVGGVYSNGVAWNGLKTVTESPTGAEASPQYADNIKYLNLYSPEDFGATIEALTYPPEWAQFDGISTPTPGLQLGQQGRKAFGLSYRSLIGNDVNPDLGYKLHCVYGATASPSEKAYATKSETPEPIAFSWDLTTTGVAVTNYKPVSLLTVDSTTVNPTNLAALELILYGTVGVDPRLPLPSEIITILSTGVTVLGLIGAPAYNATTDIVTIPATPNVKYYVNDVLVPAGNLSITKDTIIEVRPDPGYALHADQDATFFIDFS